MNDLSYRQLCLASVLSAAWLIPATSLAQDEPEVLEEEKPRSYAVEVIVFRYGESVSAGTEVFVPDPPPEILSIGEDGEYVFGDAASGELQPLNADGEPIVEEPPPETEDEIDTEAKSAYILLLEDELTMLSAWDRLDRLDAYEPLAHFGWQQDVLPFGEPIEIPLTDLAEPVEGLDGSLSLYLSRFLHLAVALELEADPEDPRNLPLPVLGEEEPADSSSTVVVEGPVDADGFLIEEVTVDPYGMPRGTIFYRIDEDRIFRSGDLRYFDHPRFGVLAKIERVEEEETEEADAGTSTPASQTP
jgi:hypothetical protein